MPAMNYYFFAIVDCTFYLVLFRRGLKPFVCAFDPPEPVLQ